MLSRNLLLQPVEQSGKPHQELSGSGDPPPPQQCQGAEEPLGLEAKYQGSGGEARANLRREPPLPLQ